MSRTFDDRGFAAVIPVGPTPSDLWRGAELIASLLHWQPDLRWCVIVDDASSDRGLAALSIVPPTCCVYTIITPRHGFRWRGAVTSGLLMALSWIHTNTDAAFTLKLDTDALVIGHFAESVLAFLAGNADAGLVGTIGMSCNPEVRKQQDMQCEPRLLTALRLLPPLVDGDVNAVTNEVRIDSVGSFSTTQQRAFDEIRPHIQLAVKHGYQFSEYCQGGAFVITQLMTARLAEAGVFESASAWISLPFWSDPTIAMLAQAAGLKLLDLSGPGDPFGIQYIGLAYPPMELLARGHSLIHSVKNDPLHSETSIRSYFAERRRHAV